MKIFQWRGRTSKTAFRGRFKTALRERLPDAAIQEIGELDLCIERPPGGMKHNVWLGRAYQEFTKSPEQVDEIISRWLRSIIANGSDTVDPDRIIPVVKDHHWLAEQKASQNGEGDFNPWSEHYNSELIVVFAEYREGLVFHHRNDYDELGVSLSELRERAFANLRRLIQGLSYTGKAGEYLVGAGGTIDASLLLVDEITRDPRIKLQGEPLAAVSDRDSFWVADDANPYAVFGIAARVAGRYQSEPYPISRQLFRKSGAVWQPLDPELVDESHPIPKLDVIDIHARKRSGGSDLVMIVASALNADARSVYRLFAKLDAYLREINSVAYREEFGQASSESTAIIVKLHPDTDPVIAKLLSSYAKWVEGRNARLTIEELAIDG
jgi:uncharacterized protein YtpQ (UPF0354 family)